MADYLGRVDVGDGRFFDGYHGLGLRLLVWLRGRDDSIVI